MLPRPLIAAALASLLFSSTAVAQGGGPELTVGLASAAVTSSDGESTTSLTTSQAVRVGFPLSPTMGIEPALAFSYASGGGVSVSVVSLSVLLPIYLGGGSAREGTYVGPALGLNRSTFSDDSGPFDDSGSASQVSLGGEFGHKFRMSDRVAFRLAGQLSRALANDDFDASTSFGAFFGVSVFFR